MCSLPSTHASGALATRMLEALFVGPSTWAPARSRMEKMPG